MNNSIPKVKRTFYSVVIKRLLDILLSGLALLVLSPVLALICILELVFHGKPIIYCTKRGTDGLLLPEEKRLTRFGYFIRKTSIDELPGIINILKGDMSIVGPRALLIEYMQYYSPRHAMRQAVRPGLTLERITKTDSKTWTWREQFENDIWYIENISFLIDVRMVFAIVKAVFKGSEYRASDTRTPFDGTNLDETRGRDELGIEKHFASLE